PAAAARFPVEMPADPAVAASVHARLQDAGIAADDRVIVVHVSAGNPFRRWPIESFAALIAALVAVDPRRRVVVTSGPAGRAAAGGFGSPGRGGGGRGGRRGGWGGRPPCRPAPPGTVAPPAPPSRWPSPGRSPTAPRCTPGATAAPSPSGRRPPYRSWRCTGR